MLRRSLSMGHSQEDRYRFWKVRKTSIIIWRSRDESEWASIQDYNSHIPNLLSIKHISICHHHQDNMRIKDSCWIPRTHQRLRCLLSKIDHFSAIMVHMQDNILWISWIQLEQTQLLNRTQTATILGRRAVWIKTSLDSTKMLSTWMDK